jgi:glycosyltransferase involved in cell wall biosynthesis
MAKSTTRKVAFISSFPPRKCGIATFTSDLINNTAAAAKGDFEPLVVAMRSDNNLKYNEPVKFEIRQKVKNDYICAADYINFSHVDLVSVQHEFGLFGGDYGEYLNLLLNKLNPPVITTLHTILSEPSEAYYLSMKDVCRLSHKVVTMNERGVDMLQQVYGVPAEKIILIPHGIPDLPFVDSNYYKYKFGMEGRRTILTFGLLSMNKGIEVVLEALPTIIEAEPTVLYVILGMTHPNVLKQDGEAYRFKLQQMVRELGLTKHVIFHNRFVDDEELHNFLCATDIYVTPYLNKEQLTSGTLSFAVGSGKAVVSTPYWAALELLSEGRGRLVGFNDSAQTAETIIELLREDSLFYSLRRRAYDYGRSRTWPKVGQTYWKLFKAKDLPVIVTPIAPASTAEHTASFALPEPSLVHLKRLTDDTGLFQHAKFTVPDRRCGYCTDDNARAVIVMSKYCSQYTDPDALRLFGIYLSFVLNSQNDDGMVRNFLNFDRTWRREEPEHDALGRVLWALGTVMAKPPLPEYLLITKDSFDKSVEHVSGLYSRGLAYSILGMRDYLKQFPGASDIKRQMSIAADRLAKLYEQNSHPDWHWFEDILTYDNAILPCALFTAGVTFDDNRYIEIAEKTCKFLLDNTFTGEHFSFVGCNGWYRRGGEKASFDQQPIEAQSTVLMLNAAYDATGNLEFLALQRKAFDWFLGDNDLHTPIYDFKTKGCNDGLGPGDVNKNQGAESLLSFLLSLLTITENLAVTEKVEMEQQQPFVPVEDVIKKMTKSKPIESVDRAEKESEKIVEELA